MKTTEKRMPHICSSSHESIENVEGKEKTERGLLHASKTLSGGGLRCTAYSMFVCVEDSRHVRLAYLYPGESYSSSRNLYPQGQGFVSVAFVHDL
jgi:hypothetical protein